MAAKASGDRGFGGDQHNPEQARHRAVAVELAQEADLFSSPRRSGSTGSHARRLVRDLGRRLVPSPRDIVSLPSATEQKNIVQRVRAFLATELGNEANRARDDDDEGAEAEAVAGESDARYLGDRSRNLGRLLGRGVGPLRSLKVLLVDIAQVLSATVVQAVTPSQMRMRWRPDGTHKATLLPRTMIKLTTRALSLALVSVRYAVATLASLASARGRPGGGGTRAKSWDGQAIGLLSFYQREIAAFLGVLVLEQLWRLVQSRAFGATAGGSMLSKFYVAMRDRVGVVRLALQVSSWVLGAVVMQEFNMLPEVVATALPALYLTLETFLPKLILLARQTLVGLGASATKLVARL